MAEPRVPGRDPDDDDGRRIELACGQTVDVHDFDLGMRGFDCDCGDSHALVLDVHPPSRFVPEALVETLRQTVETEDDLGEFGTPHIMGMVLEEFPDEVVASDCSEDGSVGWALLWVTDFSARRLHEIVVELLVELMEHAIGHAEDEGATSEFEQQMLEFDVSEFVAQYRRERDFDSEHDTAA